MQPVQVTKPISATPAIQCPEAALLEVVKERKLAPCATLDFANEIEDSAEALGWARVFERLRRDVEALSFTERAFALKRKNSTWQAMAKSHIARGDYKYARVCIGKIRDDALSPRGALKKFATICRISVVENNIEYALDHFGALSSISGDALAFRTRLISLYFEFNRTKMADALLGDVVEQALTTDQSALWLARHYHRSAEYGRARDVLSHIVAASPLKGQALLLALQCEWDQGRYDKIPQLAVELVPFTVATRPIARLFQLIHNSISAADALRDEVVRQSEKTLHGESALRLGEPALACCELGEFDLAFALASRSVEEVGVSPNAWLARGLCLADRGDAAAASVDFEHVLRLNPLSNEIYRRLADQKSQQRNGYQLARETMKLKRASLPQLYLRNRQGEPVRANADARYELQIEGDISAWADERRTTSAILQYLTAHFGQEKFRKPDPSTSQGAKLLILPSTAFGVGDEVRMARYFDRLAFDFGDVAVACDPRLVSIYRRNFPTLRFVPQQRTIETTLARNPEYYLTKNRAGSFVLNAAILREIEAADHVLLIEDLLTLYEDADQGVPLRLEPERRYPSYGPRRVGFALDSTFFSLERSRHFGDIETFRQVFESVNAEFFILKNVDPAVEARLLNDYGVKTFKGIDLYNDFESTLAVLSSLDAAFGTATFIIELAAAAGVPIGLLGLSPELVWMRSGPPSYESAFLDDRFSVNSTVITAETREHGFGPSRQDYEDRLGRHTADWLNRVMATRRHAAPQARSA